MPTRGLVKCLNVDSKARHFGDLALTGGGIDPESAAQAQHDQAQGEPALSRLSTVSSTWWKLNSSLELFSTFKSSLEKGRRGKWWFIPEENQIGEIIFVTRISNLPARTHWDLIICNKRLNVVCLLLSPGVCASTGPLKI